MNRFGNIYWFLRGSRDTASSRIQGHNVHAYLKKKNVRSFLSCSPLSWLMDFPFCEKGVLQFVDGLQANDIVILQKFEGEKTILFLKALRKGKAVVVYLDCDFPLKEEEVNEVDWIICSSSYLAERYRGKGYTKVQTIADAAECFIAPVARKDASVKKAAWYGRNSDSKWNDFNKLVTLFKSSSEANTWKFISFSNSKKATHYWDIKKSYRLIHRCDAVVIPSFGNDAQAFSKSSNRVIQAMALGLPVLASPIPSYVEVIDHGQNGFLCATDEEWLIHLQQLDDLAFRERIAQQAFDFAWENYSINKIGEEWIDFFNLITSSAISVPVHKHQSTRIRLNIDIALFREADYSRKILYGSRIISDLLHLLIEKIT